MVKYETSTGQFGLVGGTRQARSDLITVAEPRALFSPEARKGRLYVVVETVGDSARSAQVCQLALRTVRKAFYEDSSFSITASLREAVRATNDELYRYNFNASRGKRAHVGMTCAVLKDRDLFIAQVAPTQAYVLAGGDLRALPTPSGWDTAHISIASFVSPHALGSSLFIDPELYRILLQPEDMLLLCSSSLTPLLSADTVRALLQAPEPDAAIDYLSDQSAQHELAQAHALAVRLLPPLSSDAQDRPISRAGLSERGRFVWHRLGDWVTGLTGEAALATRRTRKDKSAPQANIDADAEDERQGETPPATRGERIPQPEQPLPMSYFQPKPLSIDLGESLEEQHARAAAAKPAPMPPSTFLGEGDSIGTQTRPESQQPIDLSDLSELSPHVQPYRVRYQRRPRADMNWGERLAQPFALVGSWLGHRFSRTSANYLAPSRVASVRSSSLSRPQRQVHFPWPIFLVLVVAVVFLILYGINLSRRSADERTLAYLDEAEQRMEAVFAAPDDDMAAERLQDARQAIDEVRASPLVTVTNAAFWLRYQDLRNNYEQAESSIHLLNYLDDVRLLTEHPLPSGRFASVVVPRASGNVTATHELEALRHIYALDGNSDIAQLYRIPRDGGTPEAFLRPDDEVRGTVVGPVRAHAWRINSVVAVDEGNNAYGYYFRDANGWNHIRLGGSEIWTPGARIDLETYEGNLYVWGAESNEILKFSSGRYGDIPQLWLDPAGLQGRDLGTSIDMAIDGHIYLLQPDSRIFVLNLGRFEREIVPQAVTPPMASVTSFFVTGTPAEGWIFLVDTLGERIVQIEKSTGAMVQQMKVRPESHLQLNQLTNIYIDTEGGRPVLYLVNGGQILQARMPTPPAPFSPGNAEPTVPISDAAPLDNTQPITPTTP